MNRALLSLLVLVQCVPPGRMGFAQGSSRPLPRPAARPAVAALPGARLALPGGARLLPPPARLPMGAAVVRPDLSNMPAALPPPGSVSHADEADGTSPRYDASMDGAENGAVSGVSGRLDGLSRQVSAAMESAGPVSGLGAEDAGRLGDRLERFLTGARPRAVSGVSVSGSAPGSEGDATRPDGASKPAPNAMQRQMLRDLELAAALYTEHYGPLEWKREHYGVDMPREYQAARSRVLADPDITQKEFQGVLADFIYKTRDYHVAVGFHSTEKARLPFSILGAEGRYFLAHINRGRLPESIFPFQAGDELVEFDGKPVDETLAELIRSRNVADTDARIAQARLTSRARAAGMKVPSGQVTFKIKTMGGQTIEVRTQWDYTPERVPLDIPARDGGVLPESVTGPGGMPEIAIPKIEGPLDRLRELVRRLIPSMAHPHAEIFSKMAAEDSGNPFMLGARRSFVPALGELLWEIPQGAPFHAAVYKDGQGRRIGFLRIPSYMGDEQMAGLYGRVLAAFEKNTDALVIDQVNNPGGNLLYMYTLLSMLSREPIVPARHRLIVGEGDAQWAAELLGESDSPEGLERLSRVMDMEIEGLLQSHPSVPDSLISFARFIIEELKAGRRFTRETFLLGISEIQPSQVRYTKPILVLINELDFSAGDFFPAALQDNGRAKLLGVATAGAGGAVKTFSWPNQLGIAMLSYTWTIALRSLRGGGKPVENLRVRPDIEHQLTARDLQAGFSDYKQSILKAVGEMVPPPEPARAPEPPIG